jgi:hypothetical protein
MRARNKYVTPPAVGYRHWPKLKLFQLRHLLTLSEFKADLQTFAIHTEYGGTEPDDLLVPMSTMNRKDPKQGF